VYELITNTHAHRGRQCHWSCNTEQCKFCLFSVCLADDTAASISCYTVTMISSHSSES